MQFSNILNQPIKLFFFIFFFIIMLDYEYFLVVEDNDVNNVKHQ